MTRSMAVSSGKVPRSLATCASVLPMSGLSFWFLKPTSRMFSGEPAATKKFSHSSVGRAISRFTRWRVDEGRADAERAFGHRLAHELLHPLQLCRRGRAIGVADFMNPHRGGANERGDIAGNAALGQVIQVLAQRGPLDGELEVALL